MYLCIDTATAMSGVALVKGGRCLSYRAIEKMRASEILVESIDSVFLSANEDMKNIKGVFVIKGPGSFTGLRVGISVANQFAHQLGVPIVGLRTDELWGCRVKGEGDFLYLQSMNKDEVYLAETHKNVFVLTGNIVLLSDLEKYGEYKWIGEVSGAHRERLSKGFSEITDVRPPEDTWICVCEKYADRVKPGEKYELPEPFYGKEAKITKANSG